MVLVCADTRGVRMPSRITRELGSFTRLLGSE
jgi:hypothetical protein